MKNHFRLPLILLASLLLSNTASAYIAVGAERLTLPEVIMEFRCVAALKVERIDAERGVVKYQLEQDLVGKLPKEASLKHALLVDGKPQPALCSMKPGDVVILFWGSFDPRSLVLTPAGWYQTKSPGAGDNGFERLVQVREDMQNLFAAGPAELRDVIHRLLQAERVTVPIRPKAGKSSDRLFIQYDLLDPHRRRAGAEPAQHAAEKTVDQLGKAMKSSDGLARQQAARLLGGMGKSAEPAVPALVAALDDSGLEVRAAILDALGEIGAKPETVVPVLIKGVKDQDRFVAAAGARALGAFGPVARSALPELAAALADRNYDFDYRPLRAAEAAGAILRIAPESEQAKAALDLLLSNRMLADTRADAYGTRVAAARLLGSTGIGAKPALAALVEKLGDSQPALQIAAAEAVLRIDPSNESASRAVKILTEFVTSTEPLVCVRALRAVAAVGPKARGQVIDVQKRSKDPLPAVREAAADAARALR